jgi:hypothetical protein
MSDAKADIIEAQRLIGEKGATARRAYNITGVDFRIFRAAKKGQIDPAKPSEMRQLRKLLAWLRDVPEDQAAGKRGRKTAKSEQEVAAIIGAASDIASAVAVHLAILHAKAVIDPQVADTAYCLAQSLARLASALPQSERERITPLVAATVARRS